MIKSAVEKPSPVYRPLRYNRCACKVAVRGAPGAWVDNMMVDVSMFIGKAPLIDATGNYGAVAQFKDASGLFVGRRAVSECSKVGPVGTGALWRRHVLLRLFFARHVLGTECQCASTAVGFRLRRRSLLPRYFLQG